MEILSKLVQSRLPCPDPSCGSSDAYHLYDDGHGFCFSCQKTTHPNNSPKANFTYEYIPLRGIGLKALQFYGVKTKIDEQGKPVSIGFKYPNAAHKVRFLDKKDFYVQRNERDEPVEGLFGRNLFDPGSSGSVTITEGELDAVSLYQVLGTPVVSVQSASSAGRDCGRADDRSFLNSFERIIIAFDGDDAGKRAAAEVARLFDYNRVQLVKFTRRKDANEYLQHGEEKELRELWYSAKKYLPDTIVSSLSDFKKVLADKPREGVPYPFPTLNQMTYGIRTGESVLFTAQEGVGKTELMHAIEYKLLTETSDAVAAIYLEEPKARHLQALAGLRLRRPVHLPDSGASAAEIAEAVEAVIGKDDRLYLYSHFGSDDPAILLDTIRFLVSACGTRYVILDHISMVVSGLGGEKERIVLDQLATRLEMMVKELDFSLILVSHVNDEGQTRGSRYISKVADIRIDVTRDLTAVDPIVRNTTHLVVSKNRFSGRTGSAGSLLFDPMTGWYEEISDGTSTQNTELPHVQGSPSIAWEGEEEANQVGSRPSTLSDTEATDLLPG